MTRNAAASPRAVNLLALVAARVGSSAYCRDRSGGSCSSARNAAGAAHGSGRYAQVVPKRVRSCPRSQFLTAF
eukprot:6205333-Pleurochrysis_carterae.AAC.4